MPLTGFDHQIRWSEFQKRNARPNGVDEDAEIHTAAPLNYNYSRGSDGSFRVDTITVRVSVNSSASWVVRTAQNTDLLQHEQGHYDIQALGARELYNRASNVSEGSVRDLQQRISEIGAEVQRKVDRANSRYDSETNHSRNRTQQLSWDRRLSAAKASQTSTLDNL